MRLACLCFEFRKYRLDFVYGTLKVERLAPERQISRRRIKVPKAIYFINAANGAEVEVRIIVFFRFHPPAVKALVKVLEVVPHRDLSKRRLVADAYAVTQRFP